MITLNVQKFIQNHLNSLCDLWVWYNLAVFNINSLDYFVVLCDSFSRQAFYEIPMRYQSNLQKQQHLHDHHSTKKREIDNFSHTYTNNQTLAII